MHFQLNEGPPPFDPIDPDISPGGMVFRLYATDKTTVLRESLIGADAEEAEIDAVAEDDARAAVELRDVHEVVWLVCFDGDTGRVLAAIAQRHALPNEDVSPN